MADKQQLSKFAREKLGHYVYALRNPLDGALFYVGKGLDDRVLAHANGVIDQVTLDKDEVVESLKNDIIKSIHAAGLEVECFIVQHGLASHDHAFATESAVYGTLKMLADGLEHPQFKLANKVAPPTFTEYGLRSIHRVLAQYGRPANCSLIPHNTLLIKVTKSGTWDPDMSRQEVWEATRGWWQLNKSRLDHIRYVMAIPSFVIRGVWEVEPGDWREQRAGDRGWDRILQARVDGKEEEPRLGFDSCVDVTETKFSDLLNTSIEEHFLRGAKQNNFFYLDDQRVKDLVSDKRTAFWNIGLR